MDFLCAMKPECSISINPIWKHSPMIFASTHTTVQALTHQDQTCSSHPRSWQSNQDGLMRLVTVHDFFRDSSAASRNSILAIPESIKDKKKSK
jgi:hypothetical protein